MCRPCTLPYGLLHNAASAASRGLPILQYWLRHASCIHPHYGAAQGGNIVTTPPRIRSVGAKKLFAKNILENNRLIDIYEGFEKHNAEDMWVQLLGDIRSINIY